jgi:hypothetical protein
MPIPTFTGLPPNPEFKDIVNKFNRLTAEMQNLLLSLDSLNVVSLSAGTVIVYDLDGGPGTITLTKDGMVINNGTTDTFFVDIDGNVTMTSATVQSATGFPKVIMDPSGNLFGAYETADQFILIDPIGGVGSVPAVILRDDDVPITGLIYIDSSLEELNIGSTKNIRISVGVGGYTKIDQEVRVGNWSDVFSIGASQTLQQELDAKADGSGINGTVYVAATSGGATTTAITFTNGVRTS